MRSEAMSVPEEIDTSGPAFPNHGIGPFGPGMSLRDWFAGCAMQGFAASRMGVSGPQEISERAFQVADAMLAERNKKAR
jgi:hypothetical protein